MLVLFFCNYDFLYLIFDDISSSLGVIGQCLFTSDILFYLFLYLIVVVIIGQICFRHSFRQVGILRFNKQSLLIIVVLAIFNIFSLILNQKFYNYNIELIFFVTMFLSNTIIVFVEEFINRALITEYLIQINRNSVKIILISATLFSSIHIYGVVFFKEIELNTIITTFILGIILGIYYLYTKNIYICICIHLSNNLIVEMIEGDMKYICYFIYLVLVLWYLKFLVCTKDLHEQKEN